jgi:hypothetical protein
MLSVSGLCRLPATPLQPNAPLREIRVPVDGMPERGVIRRANGDLQEVTYYTHLQGWYRRDGDNFVKVGYINNEWTDIQPTQLPTASNALPAPVQFQIIALPALPMFPVNVERIPRAIHYLWLGDTVPRQGLIDNIANNCRLSGGYRSTLHVNTLDPYVLRRIEDAFSTAAPELFVANLNHSPFFNQFALSERMPQYLEVTTGPGRNYSAASDVLRYPLVNHHGGIYMDVDDSLKVDISDVHLSAAPNDVLLGSWVSETMAGFNGYNSSIFASHANNPVLDLISAEMHRRYQASGDFFKKVRPYGDADGVQSNAGDGVLDLSTYIKNLFYLTGPDVLNDVLAIERPDYYRLLRMLEEDKLTSVTHKIVDIDHHTDLLKLTEHYFPFALQAAVDSGNEHSWLST